MLVYQSDRTAKLEIALSGRPLSELSELCDAAEGKGLRIEPQALVEALIHTAAITRDAVREPGFVAGIPGVVTAVASAFESLKPDVPMPAYAHAPGCPAGAVRTETGVYAPDAYGAYELTATPEEIEAFLKAQQAATEAFAAKHVKASPAPNGGGISELFRNVAAHANRVDPPAAPQAKAPDPIADAARTAVIGNAVTRLIRKAQKPQSKKA